MSEETKEVELQEAQVFPLLPLRDVVVYPHMVVPLFVGREKSVRALEVAMDGNRQVLLVAQKTPSQENPGLDDIYRFGTMTNILQLQRLQDNTTKLLVEGEQRAKITDIWEADGMYQVRVELLERDDDTLDPENMALLQRTAIRTFEHYVKLIKKIPSDLVASLSSIDDASRLADSIAAYVNVKLEDKQKVLELIDINERLEFLIGLLESEISMIKVEERIQNRVKTQMEKSQREYYLNEQMKAIQKELGESDDWQGEAEQLQQKIEEAGMPEAVMEKALSELSKFKMMQPMSAEATVVRNYLDWMLKVPWKKRGKVSRNIIKAKEILDADHYGLEKVKERILEYLAVQQRVKHIKGPILCLVGPPGVGKTSLGRSIARATNRQFVRMSLGGVRDEAEIRGHRRTYIGSMPGKILQNLSRVKHKNPLFLLDEIDKMAMDFRGDPASALLEVLDPEQNHAFNDHYLEVDYDLSEVMFVTTANSLKIPIPLLDRMEVIHISGYTEDEKIKIANNYLIPKQKQDNGLKLDELSIQNNALRDIIRRYTREAGVRNLEREIAKICRKTVKQILLRAKDAKDIAMSQTSKITPAKLQQLLGVWRYRFGATDGEDRVGQVTGLAWTEVGGELLTVESTIVPGKGNTTHTGQLGAVMKESIEAAMSVVRSRSDLLGIKNEVFQENDFHIHVPEGATPKDGPSAGIAMCVALISILTNIKVRSTVAMTGEITLRGEVLPIGGLKEKLLAALRGGIETVLIPQDNKRELPEIPKNIKKNLQIIPVRWIDEILPIALQKTPEPLTTETKKQRIHPASTNKSNDAAGGGKRQIRHH